MKTIFVITLLALAGCTESSTESEPEAVYEDRETVFDPMVSTIDKAKQVEQQVLDQKIKMDEALEKMEGEQ
jgi:hypothetical protein